MAATSIVFRVAVSYVRMPRSHSITSRLPCAMMYSAAISSSVTVPESPRLRSTGRGTRPTSVRSGKFCMLRAPIWRTSAYSATSSTCRVSMTSVTTGSPVARRVSARSSSPSRPIPWNAYGEERGLKAPPRSRRAPAARTRSAVVCSISRPSTEQGPAITTTSDPPMMVSAGSPKAMRGSPAANSREARR